MKILIIDYEKVKYYFTTHTFKWQNNENYLPKYGQQVFIYKKILLRDLKFTAALQDLKLFKFNIIIHFNIMKIIIIISNG